MKGIFNSAHANYSIDIQGEKWRQGDQIKISVQKEVKDSNESPSSLMLAHVDLKKFNKGDPKAITSLYQLTIDSKSQDIIFDLDQSCPVSDKTKATLILVGNLELPQTCDRLELPINERLVYSQMIESLALFQRLQLANIKNKTNSLNAKFKVPTGNDYASIDGLNILFSSQQDKVHLSFVFQVSRLAYTPEGVKAQKEVVSHNLEYTLAEIYVYTDSFNQDKFKTDVDVILDKVKKRSLL